MSATLTSLPAELVLLCAEVDIVGESKLSPLCGAVVNPLLFIIRSVNKQLRHVANNAPGPKRDWAFEAWQAAQRSTESEEYPALFHYAQEHGADYAIQIVNEFKDTLTPENRFVILLDKFSNSELIFQKFNNASHITLFDIFAMADTHRDQAFAEKLVSLCTHDHFSMLSSRPDGFFNVMSALKAADSTVSFAPFERFIFTELNLGFQRRWLNACQFTHVRADWPSHRRLMLAGVMPVDNIYELLQYLNTEEMLQFATTHPDDMYLTRLSRGSYRAPSHNGDCALNAFITAARDIGIECLKWVPGREPTQSVIVAFQYLTLDNVKFLFQQVPAFVDASSLAEIIDRATDNTVDPKVMEFALEIADNYGWQAISTIFPSPEFTIIFETLQGFLFYHETLAARSIPFKVMKLVVHQLVHKLAVKLDISDQDIAVLNLAINSVHAPSVDRKVAEVWLVSQRRLDIVIRLRQTAGISNCPSHMHTLSDDVINFRAQCTGDLEYHTRSRQLTNGAYHWPICNLNVSERRFYRRLEVSLSK